MMLCLGNSLFLLPEQVQAQELIKISTLSKKVSSGEVYHVLKSDKKTLHGTYEMYQYGKLRQAGTYEMGEKSGIWKDYHYNGSMIRSSNYEHGLKNGPFAEYYPGKGEMPKQTGTYRNDHEAAVWQFFNSDGSLHLSFDFDSRKILFFKGDRSNSTEWTILHGADTITAVLDKAPFLIGNENELPAFISKNIKYPEIALENGIEGIVIIGFTVDEEGKCSDVRIVKDIGAGCGAEAMRVFNRTLNFWLPGELNGLPVSVPMTLPVRFKMSR
jgi:TonB family protein